MAMQRSTVTAEEVAEDYLSKLTLAWPRMKDTATVAKLLIRLHELYGKGDEVVRFQIISGIGRYERYEAIALLEQALKNDPSSLVRHEAAFGLGQIGNHSCITSLVKLGLRDKSYLVRHESAMALATVGDESVLPILEAGLTDTNHEVVVSCQLAISRIRYRLSVQGRKETSMGKRGAQAALRGFVKESKGEPYYLDDVTVVFIDMVAFSSLSDMSDMSSKVHDMQDSLFGVLDPHYHWDEKSRSNDIIVIPTGDGYAIAFHHSVPRKEVLERVGEIYRRIVHERRIDLRIGISRGPHIVFIDLNNTLNLIGEGIIRAQRAMTAAGVGQIFCTGEFVSALEGKAKEGFTKFSGLWQIKSEEAFELHNYVSRYGHKDKLIGRDGEPDSKFQYKS